MKLTDKQKATWYSYHSPGCSKLTGRRKVNAIFFSPSNSLKHELAKAEVCYEIQKHGGKFITEAVRNKVDEKTGKERRVDVVDLCGVEFEIETTKKRAERFEGEKGVIVVKLWEKKEKVRKVTHYMW